MKLKTYQQLAQRTAIYPEHNAAAYLATGFVAEAMEMGLALERYGVSAGEEQRDDVIAEAGDILWFYAQICTEQGVDMEMTEVEMSADWVTVGCYMLLDPYAKSLRKGEQFFMEQIDRQSAQLIASQAAAIANVVAGLTLEEVLEKNIQKLASRQERGVLEGSGDHR